ncbi:MAG: hypothetical protein OIF55_19250 [Amphritea sp.]|nr:hypothetical protein [Amphritea sp.]
MSTAAKGRRQQLEMAKLVERAHRLVVQGRADVKGAVQWVAAEKGLNRSQCFLLKKGIVGLLGQSVSSSDDWGSGLLELLRVPFGQFAGALDELNNTSMREWE